MAKMIQVRNVPDYLHRALKARAAEAGLTLTDYIQGILEHEVARPSKEDLLERLKRVKRVRFEPSAAEIIREMRDTR